MNDQKKPEPYGRPRSKNSHALKMRRAKETMSLVEKAPSSQGATVRLAILMFNFRVFSKAKRKNQIYL
jgi:hypothetical protein